MGGVLEGGVMLLISENLSQNCSALCTCMYVRMHAVCWGHSTMDRCLQILQLTSN